MLKCVLILCFSVVDLLWICIEAQGFKRQLFDEFSTIV
jgi:hypothetical protein